MRLEKEPGECPKSLSSQQGTQAQSRGMGLMSQLLERLKQEKEFIVVSMHTLSTRLERNVTGFLRTGSRENMGTDAELHVTWRNRAGHMAAGPYC